MQIEIETVPESAKGHENTVTISYSPFSDRFCVISKTAIAAVDLLLASALDHVRVLKKEIMEGESRYAQLCVSTIATLTADGDIEDVKNHPDSLENVVGAIIWGE